MVGDYYSTPNPLLKGTLNSVERERLRERQREERAQMTYSSDTELLPAEPLFGELVKVNPKSGDRETQQIQRKLGKYEDVRHLLQGQESTLVGIDGIHPSPAPVTNNIVNNNNNNHNNHGGSSNSSSSSGMGFRTGSASMGSSSSVVGGTSSSMLHGGHEFKKPCNASSSQQLSTATTSRSSASHHRSSNIHHHSSASSNNGSHLVSGNSASNSQRAGFVKPSDGNKPSYASGGSKNFYSSGVSQNIKQHNNNANSDFRNSNVTVSMKSLPPSSSGTNSSGNHHSSSSSGSSRSSSHAYQSSKTLPKLHIDVPLLPAVTASSQSKIENILDEMAAAVRTPLTGIAATPRKEMEPNFTFNPVSGKMESLVPPVKTLDSKNKSINYNNLLGPPGRITSVYKGPPLTTPLPLFNPSISAGNVAVNNNSSSHGPFSVARSPSFSVSRSPSFSVRSPSLSVSRSPSLSVSRSPSLSVSRSPSLSVSRSPSLPVSRSPSFPVSRSPSFLVSRSPSLSVSHSPSSSVPGTNNGSNVGKFNSCNSNRHSPYTSLNAHTPLTNNSNNNTSPSLLTSVHIANSSSSISSSNINNNNGTSIIPSANTVPVPLPSSNSLSGKSILPPSSCLKSDLSLSEDSDEDQDNDSEDDSATSLSKVRNKPQRSPILSKTVAVNSAVTNGKNMVPPNAVINCTSSSDDSESDSCSDSEDSSSAESDSPATLPLPLVDEEQEKRRWSLQNFLPSTSASASQSNGSASANQACPKTGSNEKTKTNDDSDSSSAFQKSLASSSSSSDSESNQSSNNNNNNINNNNNKTIYKDRSYARKNSKLPSSKTTSRSTLRRVITESSDEDEVITASRRPIHHMSRCSSRCDSSADECEQPNNRDRTLVGIVRPSQRKPPSPVDKTNNINDNVMSNNNSNNNNNNIGQPFRSMSPESNDERYDYLRQQRLRNPLTSSTVDVDTSGNLSTNTGNNNFVVDGNNRRNNDIPRISQQQQSSSMSAVKSSSSVVKGAKGGRGRKPKSPAASGSSLELPVNNNNAEPIKKKRGRKRKKSVPSESDDFEEPPKIAVNNNNVAVKPVEKRGPGRPPTKKLAILNNTNNVANKTVQDNNNNNKRRSTVAAADNFNTWNRARMPPTRQIAETADLDSDSEVEIVQPAVPTKPTARVMPAVKRKESRSVRESPRNDDINSLNVIRESPPKLDIEAASVSDKKKSDTLRKLFSRREEPGGKGKGGAKGGKGKTSAAVIILESSSSEPVERKLSERYRNSPLRFNDNANRPSSSDRMLTSNATAAAATSNNLSETSSNNRSTRQSDNITTLGGGSNNSSSSSSRNTQPFLCPENICNTIKPLPGFRQSSKPEFLAMTEVPRSILVSIPWCALTLAQRKKLQTITDETPNPVSQPDNVVAKTPNVVLPPDNTVKTPNAVLPSDNIVKTPNPVLPPDNIVKTPNPIFPTDTRTTNATTTTTTTNSNFDNIVRQHITITTSSIICNIASTNASTTLSNEKYRTDADDKSDDKSEYYHRCTLQPLPRHDKDEQRLKSSSSSLHRVRYSSSDDDRANAKSLSTIPLASSRCNGNGDNNHRSTLPNKQPTTTMPVSINAKLMDVDPYRGVLGVENNLNTWIDNSVSSSSEGGTVKDNLRRQPRFAEFPKYEISDLMKLRRKRLTKTVRRSSVHASPSQAAPTPTHTLNTNHDRNTNHGLPNSSFQICDLRPVVPIHHGIYYSYLERKAAEETMMQNDDVNPNVYLLEAKRIKHLADGETEPIAQGMQYLEAILLFVLTGNSLERKNQQETAYSMYSETLKLIEFISKRFKTYANTYDSSVPNKIAILSMRCECILTLKLYKVKENEMKAINTAVSEYFNKPLTLDAIMVNNTPSPHSPTPSPASSVGSTSSGYCSDKRPSYVSVPSNIHMLMFKQHGYHTEFLSCLSTWNEADQLIFRGHKDFFVELDRFCGPLTLNSSFYDLVHYVRVGVQRLKGFISHSRVGSL